MWFYVVEEGQRVLMRNPDGTMEVIVGPRRVWRGSGTFQPMPHHVAHPGDYLIVRYRDGRQEHLPGPAEVWFDPRIHQEVTCEEMLQVAAKEAVVVYSSKEGTSAVQRRIEYGPTLVHAPARRVAAHLRLARVRGRRAGRPKSPQRAGLPEALADARPDVPRRPRRPHRRRRRAHHPPDDLLRAARHRPRCSRRPTTRSATSSTPPPPTSSTSPAGTTSSRSSGTPTSSTSWRPTASSPAAGLAVRLPDQQGRLSRLRVRPSGSSRCTTRRSRRGPGSSSTAPPSSRRRTWRTSGSTARCVRAGKRRRRADRRGRPRARARRQKQEAELRDREARPAFEREQQQLDAEFAGRITASEQDAAAARAPRRACVAMGVDLTAYLTQGRADRVIELRGPGGPTHVHLGPRPSRTGAAGAGRPGGRVYLSISPDCPCWASIQSLDPTSASGAQNRRRPAS